MPKIIGNSLAEHRERTRNALFEALSALMSHRSFDKITLSDVAAQAGVGRTAVYNHFANKEDLLLAFMEHEAARYSQELSQALEGIQDPVDRLRVYVRQQATGAEPRPTCGDLRILTKTSQVSPRPYGLGCPYAEDTGSLTGRAP